MQPEQLRYVMHFALIVLLCKAYNTTQQAEEDRFADVAIAKSAIISIAALFSATLIVDKFHIGTPPVVSAPALAPKLNSIFK